MSGKKTTGKKKTYTAAPVVPEELRDRYLTAMAVLYGQLSVAEGARRLGMSRNHFQTLLHRGQALMLEGLAIGKPGRPAKPKREAELEAEVESLRRRLAQLEKRVEMTDQLMGLAGRLLHGTTRARAPRSKSTSSSTRSPEDDESEHVVMTATVERQLEQIGLPRTEVARCLGIPETTLRRWRNCPSRPRVRRATPVPSDVRAAIVADVRATHGLVGAESLRRAHPGVSRRVAAAIKRETRTALERERRAASARVEVTACGVLRSFDAMDRGREAVPRYVLVASDGAVPYRTTVAPVRRYDTDAVAALLAHDFEEHGAPLVLRMDRARCHRAPAVRAVLDAHGVLVLHGPPRHPRFYGQLERQNREHAMWLQGIAELPEELLHAMREALNGRWRRRSLGWQTAHERWRSRPPLPVDRHLFRANIERRVAELRGISPSRKMTEDLASRLAIQHELIKLGYLRIKTNNNLLGDLNTQTSPF